MLVLYGYVFGCLDDCLVMAAILAKGSLAISLSPSLPPPSAARYRRNPRGRSPQQRGSVT